LPVRWAATAATADTWPEAAVPTQIIMALRRVPLGCLAEEGKVDILRCLGFRAFGKTQDSIGQVVDLVPRAKHSCLGLRLWHCLSRLLFTGSLVAHRRSSEVTVDACNCYQHRYHPR
jgi:hypothetical protein